MPRGGLEEIMHWLRANPTTGASGAAPLPSAPSSNIEGRRVGPYQLQSELGRGGMGSVWLARRDDGQYEGQVAIKLLSASWLGREGEQRFRQEGTLLARLDHPNIARLLDAGVTELGQPYLVLEYVQGERVDDYCRQTGLNTRARIELFLELLDAVAHAHRKLIVHRDIKPANVLVTNAGNIKLLDFGISKLVDQDALLTRTDHAMMTPEFASPEQLLGEPVTTATDIYALGLLLYLLLTGRLPFLGATSPAELMRRITTGAMPLPSRVAVQPSAAGTPATEHSETGEFLRRELRGDLDNIVLKAVHSTPELRYQDVPAFAADLRRHLNHEPVSARASTLAYRIRKFARRNRGGVVATFLVVLSITMGSVFGLSQWLEAQRQRDEARNQESTANLISDVLNFALNSDGGPDRPQLSIAEHVERSAELIERRYAHDAKFIAKLLLLLAESLNNAPQTTKLDLLQRAHELGRKSGDPEIMARALCSMVRHNAMAGSVPQALERMQQAQHLLVGLEAGATLRVECLLAEAMVEALRANRARAIPLVLEAAHILERGGLDDREAHIDVLSYLGGLYLQDGNLRAAIEVTERTARISTELGMGDTSEHLAILQNHAVQLMATGEVGKSLAEREQVNRMGRRFYTADTFPLTYLYNHAMLLLRMERSVEALTLIDSQLQRVRNSNEPATLVDFLQGKARTHVALGQWELAEHALAEARPLLELGVGPPHTKSYSEAIWAEIALSRKDAAGARNHVAAALSLSGYGSNNPERTLRGTLLLATRVALAANQRADAEKFATEALRISERNARGPDSSADVGHSLLLLAEATASTASPATLHTMLERAVTCLSNGLHPEHRLTVEARRMLEERAPRSEGATLPPGV
jgi:serine/threonine-protein kinase